MKSLSRYGAAVLLVAAAVPLAPSQAPFGTGRDRRLPNGKSQQEEILKADHKKNLKDAAQLADLAQELKEDLEKNDRHVLSVTTLKKTDEIEKLVKRIRGRLRRY